MATTIEFIRRHHLLTALMLLSAAVILYAVGLGVGAMILIAAALLLELAGWLLLFRDGPERSSDL